MLIVVEYTRCFERSKNLRKEADLQSCDIAVETSVLLARGQQVLLEFPA